MGERDLGGRTDPGVGEQSLTGGDSAALGWELEGTRGEGKDTCGGGGGGTSWRQPARQRGGRRRREEALMQEAQPSGVRKECEGLPSNRTSFP